MVKNKLEKNIQLFLKIVSLDERVPKDIRIKSEMFSCLMDGNVVIIRGFRTTVEFLQFLSSRIKSEEDSKIVKIGIVMMLMECYDFPLYRALPLAEHLIEQCINY